MTDGPRYFYVWCTKHGDQSWMSSDDDPLLPCCAIPLNSPGYERAMTEILSGDLQIDEGPLVNQVTITH